jgi:gluconate 5-dehydrogenase
MKNMFDLSGKVALITGGLGGIGQAMAVALAEAGADIAVLDRDVKGFSVLKNKIESMNKKAVAVSADVTREEQVQKAVNEVQQTFGHIDILINAAGITCRKPALTFPIEEWKRVLEVNTVGTFICSKTVGVIMAQQKKGKIINLSSVRGRFAGPFDVTAYCSSKGAVDNLTRALACELGKQNILVNAIAPTIVETSFVKDTMTNPKLLDPIVTRTPLGRWAQTDDLIGAVIFFASAASDFVTGQILYIDGGLTTWV